MLFAERGGTRLRQHIMPGFKNLKVAIYATVSVSVILLLMRWVFNWPKQLFLLVTGSFVFVSILGWFIMRNHASVTRGVTVLLGIWLAPLVLLLSVIYQVDRAGWNWFRLTGYDTTLSESYEDRIEWSLEQFIQRHPEFTIRAQDRHELLLTSGEYVFHETVIIPKHTQLIIEEGTQLRFGAGCSLVSYSPVIAMGTESEPVSIGADNPLFKWGVLGVVDAEGSIFNYVQFANARQAHINKIDFFAGLSMIRSDVIISNCRFENMFGKDAVNIRYANARVVDNLFQNVYKDGLDMDGGSGIIRGNRFINCQDEGIDLSENIDIEVLDNVIVDSKGGRIEAENNLAQIKQGNTFGFLTDVTTIPKKEF